jgi:hypothetical protein
MAEDLETVLARLLAAEINVSIATVPPGHISVRIHDPNGGPDLAKNFTPDAAGSSGAIAPWLLKTAQKLYAERLDAAKPPHPGLM